MQINSGFRKEFFLNEVDFSESESGSWFSFLLLLQVRFRNFLS